MSRRSMYFGTRDRMAWVACPAVERDSGAVGWSESGTYLNGGAFVARSKGSHRVHEMAWNMISRKEAGKIESFASGVYGDGPYYWIDPMAADHNVLPTNWAYPAQELDTGISLSSVTTSGSVVSRATPAGAIDTLPTQGVTYTFPASTSVGRRLFVPIPPEHRLWVGAWGELLSGTSGVYGAPINRSTGAIGSRSRITLAAPGSTSWQGTVWNGNTYSGVLLDVGNSGSISQLALYGMIAQVLPNGRTPLATGWLDGLGTSGAEFEEFPERTDYSSVMDKVGLTATLVEVGTWL